MAISAAQTLLDDQQEFITTLQDETTTIQHNAQNHVLGAKPPPISYTPVVPPKSYTPTPPPLPPEFDIIDLDLPEQVAPMGELTPIPDPNPDDAPIFDVPPPELNFGTTPNQVADFRGTAPSVTTSFAFPSAPSQLDAVFVAPTVPDRAEPPAPEYVQPDFTAVEPVNDTAAPTNLDRNFRANYDDMSLTMKADLNERLEAYLLKINPLFHTQMHRVEAQLTRYLDGGTGLDPSVEQAIYDRAREKNDREAERVRDASYAEAANRGFTMPSGLLLGAVARARQEAANNNLKASTDVAIAQAEMEQKNLQFAVTTSNALRNTALNSMLSFMQNNISINGQALEYAKDILNSVIQTYDLQVKEFSLKLDAYKAIASVYEVKMRAAAQVVEIYKARIQALEALTNVDRAKIAAYQAQLDSLKTYGEIYKTQIEVVVSKASLEKLKLDLFQTQVQIYSVQVQAKTAEWQGYQARIQGEEAKTKAFGAQVDAYNGQIAAFKAKTDGISEQIKGVSMRNTAVIQEYTARVSAYEAEVRAAATTASANIDGQRQALTGYQGQVEFAVAQAKLAIEAYKTNSEVGLSNAKNNMDMQVSNAQVSLGAMNAIKDLYGEILKVYSGPATAAASGMNALAAINFDE